MRSVARRHSLRRPKTGRRIGIAVAVATALAALLAAATPVASRPAPDSPVADAAMRRDGVKLRQLLKQGADVNAAQGDGMTALHWAATHGDVDEARMLIYAGARVDALTRNGNYTPLHLAARAGHVPAVRALLEGGANANAKTSSGGATPLHFAAAQGNTESIAVLLDRGAAVDAREGAWEQTPLMWAGAYNRVNAIKALIGRGANIAAVSKVEDIPARERADRAAAQLRNRRIAALKAAEQPPRPAGAAGAAGAADSARIAGAPNAARDSAAGRARAEANRPRGDSAAPRTTGARDSSAVPGARNAAATRPATSDSSRRDERAISYGELVGNKGGLTPLLFAVRQGNTTAAMTLLDAGAKVNQVSEGDQTSPLLMAAINGHFDLAKKLLARGADPKLASAAGATPLYATINVQWAAKSLYPQPTAQTQQETTYLELMEVLLEAGADPNARLTKHLWYMSYNFDLLGVNTTGATPFWRAAYGTDVPAMRLLVKYGADPKVPTQKPAGRQRGADAPAEDDSSKADPSGLPPVPVGGPGVYPIHAASGVGYGEGYAANSHRHAPEGWMPAVKYLVEELGADVNARDHNGYNPIHHAAARGDNELIEYLVSKGADVKAVSRRGQTTADMANGPVQRIPPFLETVALLEKLGSKNNHKCRSC
ncbi:MAG TPA: ankyrin repeat domain-containing protein [Gemmatimonadaceae bacterium]|nr:ankyrin repeat domain-containing protein [Gemmatimonadaceae bacterium]